MTRAHGGAGPRVRLGAALALGAAITSAGAWTASAAPTPSGGTVVAPGSADTATASLDRTTVPATGRQLALMTVERFGRFAVTSKSAQGVGLQLVDRVSGPSEVAGEAGTIDGRLEGFLDHGEYRVVALADEKGTGTAKLEAHPFHELHAKPPLIPLVASVSTTLSDFEQRSWWLHVETRQNVAIEAAGRFLGDLRLWRDGQWLVDAEPARDVSDPAGGRPLTTLRFAPLLEPGLYLLTAYGGVPQPWSRDDASSPFLMRLGFPELAESGRQRRVTSAFGVDRFVVPGAATFFRIELDEAPASLGVGDYDVGAPFDAPGSVGEVTKETIPPAVEVRVGGRQDQERMVVVTAPPGKAYVLQQFDAGDRQTFSRDGHYWVSTVDSGHATDSIDATGVVWTSDWVQHPQPAATQIVELGADAAWARRFNLLERTTLFLHVKEAGSYEVDVEGLDASCRIEPWFATPPPQGYEPPELRKAGSRWDLDEGWNVLTLVPDKIGIASVAVRKAGLWDRLLGFIGHEKEKGLPPLRPSLRFPDMTLTSGHSYYLEVNTRPGIETGLVLRELPIDLAKALPLALAEGETLTIPARVGEASTVRAELEDGTTLPVGIDDAAPVDGAAMSEGVQHRVTIAAPAAGGPRIVSLVATAVREAAPLPDLPADLEPKPLDLPVLALGKPQFFDLDRQESKTFLMQADEGALYRIETTGLLATEGNLRNRVVTSLARSSEGGTGRNFLIQQFVRSGDYQVTVTATGRSKGHVGLDLAKTPIADGGDLEDGAQENATLRGGQGIAYMLDVPEKSTWHLRAFSLGRTLRCRIEDVDGWPLEAPGGDADITRELLPGRYRFIVLPEPVTARVAVVADRVKDPETREGHGPFALAFDDVAPHVWLESPEGADRVPDRWTFTLPATSEVTITLGNGMEGVLSRGDHVAGSSIASLHAGHPWTGELDAHPYEIEVTSPRRDNHRSYTIQVRPKALLAGMSRRITAPAELEIASEEGGDIQIASSGGDDVRARLLDEKGGVLATSDDATDDWNFRMTTRAWSGVRKLAVEPVGAASAETTISVEQVMPAPLGELVLTPEPEPESVTVTVPAGRVGVLRFTPPAGEGILIVTAEANRPITLASGRSGMATERTADSGRSPWLAVPVAESSPVEIQLSSSSARAAKARVAVRVFATTPYVLGATPDADVALRPVGLADFVAAPIHVAGEGLLAIDASDILDARLPPGRLERSAEPTFVMAGENFWVAGRRARREPAVHVRRVVLGESERELTVRPSPEASIDVARPPAGGLFLVLARSASGQPWLGGSAWPGGAAVIVSDGDDRQVVVRDLASHSIAGSPVSLDVVEIADVQRSKDSGASWAGSLPPGGEGRARAQSHEMADGFKELRLSLDAGTFAVLDGGGPATRVVGALDRSVDETLGTEATSVTIIAVDDATGRHAVEAKSAVVGSFDVDGAVPLERIEIHAGLLDLSPPEAGMLHVRGARDAVLVDSTGRLQRGRDFTVDHGLQLVLEHAVGPVAAWVDDGSGVGAWGSGAPATSTRVRAPARLELAGATQTLRVDHDGAALLSIRTSHPVVARLRRDGEEAQADAWPEGARLDAWLPTGKTEIDLRGFASETLVGSADVALTPAEPLTEGAGVETLIPAGTARPYTFTLDEKRTIGIGVRASSDTIDAQLLDAHGQLIGTGIVQMPTLEAGSYVLVLKAPADGPPISARPALVGVKAPDTGPPEDVVRAFVEGEEIAPAAAAPTAPGWEQWLGVRPVEAPPSQEGSESGGEGEGEESNEGGD